MKFMIDFYVIYSGAPHCVQRYPFDFFVEHEAYGRPINGWRAVENFIKKLCERREFYAQMDTPAFFRVGDRPLVGFSNLSSASLDVITQNAKYLMTAITEGLNLYVPEKFLLSFAHFLFKTFPCCQESYHSMMDEASRTKRRFIQEGRKAEYKPPQLIMRKSYYIPMRHHRDHIILPKGRFLDSDDLKVTHDFLDETVAAHLWSEDSPYTTCNSEPFISMKPHPDRQNCFLEVYGASPYLIETFRVGAGHRANYVIADFRGTTNVSHPWSDWHVINLNIFAAYVMTTAIYHQYEYGENTLDYMYMRDIWEVVAQLARLNTDMEGSNILRKRADAAFDAGITPIIKSW